MSTSTLKNRDITIDTDRLTKERIATISDNVVKDLAEISQLKLPGNLHLRIHFQHSKTIIIINGPVPDAPKG